MQEKQPIRIVLLGPPGCGKGTQAANLKDTYNLHHLSTGDLLRAAIAQNTQAGLKAKGYMQCGELVPDETVLEVLQEALESKGNRGFILDGFPRTLKQAEQLDGMLPKNAPLTHVLEFDIPDDQLVKRILGRLIHPASGRTYHVEFCPPKRPMLDDLTGEPLVRRADDNEEALKRRLRTFHRETKPLEAYYSKRGILHNVDASAGSAIVWSQLRRIIDNVEADKKIRRPSIDC